MINGFKPLRNAAAAGFAATSVVMTMSANAESLAPNLPPNAPSAVYGATNAQLDSMLQQLGVQLQKRGSFDGIAFAENHCWPQGAQLPAAEQTIAFFKKFQIGGVATENPDMYQVTFDTRIVPNKQDKIASDGWVEYITGSLPTDCKKINGLSNKLVGSLEGQGHIDAARKLDANGMLWFASDYSWQLSDKYTDRNGNIADMVKFENARLDERDAAKHINDTMGVGAVAIVRGARHLLQYSPTTLRSQFEQYGRKIVTVAFDYTGHDVSDELALFTKEGHKVTLPDLVMDWKNKTVYSWSKPEASLGVKQSSLEPLRNNEAVAQALPPLAATQN